MSFHYTRRYSGPVQAVIFDWCGTTVDHGSRAPAQVFVNAFKHYGVEITETQARAPMGMAKRDHVRTIANMPEVAAQWQAIHGSAFNEADVSAIYEKFVALQQAIVADYAKPINGVVDVVTALRQRNIRIGSTTGYPRPIMEVLAPASAAHGFAPDNMFCEGDLPCGRPSPLMALQSLIELQVWPVQACIKVDDTVVGIEEGLNAGMWSVGVALTGNEAGLSETELAALDTSARNEISERVAQHFFQTGAHYVIDSVADLLPVVEDIEQRMARGEQP